MVTTKTKTTKKAVKKSAVNLTTKAEAISTDFSQVNRDTVNAILIVSLAINLFVLVGWVTLQVTTAYDSEVASFLFVR